MVTLLNVPISPFGTKVKMAMLEKGIAFETREPDLEAAQTGGDPELTSATSPRLEIPLLIDGDVVVFDSTIILEYVEERWPEPPMLPPTPAERARVRMLEDVCDTTYEAAVWGVYEVLMMGRVAGAPQEALLARGRAEVDGLNAWLDRQLAGREWMNGARFGWGDVSVYPHVHNADRLGRPPPSGSALASWLGRMRERPSAVQLDAEFAAWSLTPLNRPLGTSGTWKRLYKSHRLEWMIRAGGIDVVARGIANDDVRFSPEIR
jgi:glutathione S-transferase/RNA polymerase-associated protein